MSTQLDLDSHSLVEILPSEWKTLLNLYQEKKTESTGYNLINNYIKWLDKEPDLEIKCLSLDGDWKRDGTFLLTVNHGTTSKYLFFNTFNLENLTKALCCFTSKPNEYLLYGYGERLKPAVDEYLKNFNHLELQTVPTAWYKASKKIVDNFSTEVPVGITLRTLDIDAAPTINEIWPHRAEGSVNFVKRLIIYNISVGAYDSDGKLIAWCLRLPTGALGLLQVVESHKRLGLGNLLVRYLSKKISELGDEVLAPVVTENTPSRKMFEKLGFQKIDNVYWTFPNH